MMATKKKPRIGRPPLPEGVRKSVMFCFRFTADELEAVEKAAEKADKTSREWARAKLLRGLRLKA